jgi:hypothetical protein
MTLSGDPCMIIRRTSISRPVSVGERMLSAILAAMAGAIAIPPLWIQRTARTTDSMQEESGR